MRISNSYVFSTIRDQLGTNYESVFNNQNLINTGKKYLIPSDDPSSAITAIKIKKTLRENSYYSDRQEAVKPYLQIADTQISSMTDAIRSIKTDLVLAANGTNDATQLATLSNKIDKTLEAIVMAANGKYNNTYLFAGANNQTMPFEINGDKVLYHGTSHTTQQEINKGITADVMVPGSKIFETHNIEALTGVASVTDKLSTTLGAASTNFTIQVGDGPAKTIAINYPSDSMQDVIDRINTNVPDVKAYAVSKDGLNYLKIDSQIVGTPGQIKITDSPLGTGFMTSMGVANAAGTILGSQSSYSNGLVDAIISVKNALLGGDISGIPDAAAKIDAAYNNILTVQGNLGFEVQRIETAQSLTSNENARLKELESKTEDIDMISAVTELQNRQTAYEAAMATSAKIMKLSILNYM